MKYGIHFDNDSANKSILATLTELDDTFFIKNIENSSSESEKNTSDNEVLSNSDKIESLKENFDKIHLSNFEFMENSDNYIEDKIYDNLKLKVKKAFEKRNCSCHSSCYEKISYERFLAHWAEFKSLDKNVQDMVIKGQLIAFQKDENTKKVNSNNRKFLCFNYCFNNSLSICHTTYQDLVGVGHTYLDNVIKYFREYGLEERIYGNTGRALKNMKHVEVNYGVASEIYNFLKNYSDIYGIPSPGWYFNKISIPVVFLLTSYSYALVYHNYV